MQARSADRAVAGLSPAGSSLCGAAGHLPGFVSSAPGHSGGLGHRLLDDADDGHQDPTPDTAAGDAAHDAAEV